MLSPVVELDLGGEEGGRERSGGRVEGGEEGRNVGVVGRLVVGEGPEEAEVLPQPAVEEEAGPLAPHRLRPSGRRVQSGAAPGGQGVRPSGSGRPFARQQAVSVLARRQAMVIGPTPPGTGVIAPATSAAEA